MRKIEMSSANPLRLDLVGLAHAIKAGQIGPVETTRELLERICALDGELNTYVTVTDEEALSAASRAEKKLAAGDDAAPLLGVPVALKDIIYTKGIRTTMGSEFFEDFIPDQDAAVVEKLKRAGAVIIGKTNTHQFAYGPTGDRSHFGPARNPHDPTRITGGSSSGSGAAVAAFLCHAALGTDTGGSVRIPASCCGVVGMKPTYGLVSKHGVFPLSWTLDHVGPMTRTVRDNAVLLNVLAGHDARDPHSVRRDGEDYARRLEEGIEGGVVGVPSSFYFDLVQQEVASKVRQAICTLRDLGAEVREVEIPHMEEILSAQRLTMAVEAFTVHRKRLLAEPERFEEEVRERLMTGEGAKAYEYVRAQQTRWGAIEAFDRTLEKVDVLVSPTLPALPTVIDEREADIEGHKEHVRPTLTRLVGPTNLNGFPSLTIPCGFSDSGMPIGLQLMGKPFDEANLYRFGHAFERAGPLYTQEHRPHVKGDYQPSEKNERDRN